MTAGRTSLRRPRRAASGSGLPRSDWRNPGGARAFARCGADVALLARNADALDNARAEVESYGRRALAVPVDVSDADAVERATFAIESQLGPIDVWVNNAMVTVFSPVALLQPSLHLHACCAAPRVRHMEYFHDHVRIEQMLFDGALSPVGGGIAPDLRRPGLGLELKEADAQPFAA